MRQVLFKCPIEGCKGLEVVNESELMGKGGTNFIYPVSDSISDDTAMVHLIQGGSSDDNDDELKRYSHLGSICITHSVQYEPICFIEEDNS